ncbi:MAG: hypothetical protein K0Q55_2902 [Verrucomicrobia bacterium]|jgi:Tfp pilus assembly protein PilV|nr:hypothetical protein [Verrucomicrobiota bacterium]
MKIVLKQQHRRAFSLMEVMIAIAIFFMAIFAILELTSRNLKLARALQQPMGDPGAVAAMISLTNQLDEMTMNGDMGPDHPEIKYTWTAVKANLTPKTTEDSGLFRVDIVVSQPLGGKIVETPMSVYMFRPQGAPQAGATTTTGSRSTLPSGGFQQRQTLR